MSACQSCGAPIRWGVTTAGGRMPLDASPAPAGNVWIRPDGKLRILNEQEAARARAAGYVLHMSHHATCPTAGRHRTPRAQETLDLGAA